ncbi:hypothetical protein [Marinilabilia salmonicolor]|uniref:hypothetical protein n=1 Tax=Marinilabilia salmonicolor TaxID=989 RepID=UPI00029AE7DF|nr:hypothetical protein [Marinilabilia salmonicolor]
MATPKEHIIGIHVEDRFDEAQQVQEILTRYGCSIKTRLGLHNTNGTNCSQGGIIILQLIPDNEKAELLIRAMKKLEGVEVKEMVF